MTGDLVIIVPGITGSVLARGESELWSLSAAALRRGMLHTSTVLEELILPTDQDEVEKYALESPEVIRGVHVWPGFWHGPGYARLIDRLNAAVPGRVICFAYDWRMPNAYTAHRLQKLVEQSLKRFPDSRVTFVCHSMGGLIARYYLEVLGGSAVAARLITIGTPFSGSLKAVKALTGQLQPRFPALSANIARVAATFPSVAELLPTYRCVTAGPGHEPLSLIDTDIPGLSRGLVLQGRRFHDKLREAIRVRHADGRVNRESYAVHVFAGKQQDTDQSLTVDESRIEFQRTQRGVNHGGDGTVSCFSAIPPEWKDDGHALFRAAKHGPLASHRDLLDDVVAAATARELGAILAPLDTMSLELPEVAAVEEPIALTVNSASANLRLRASVFDADDQPYATHIPMLPDRGGCRYTRSLALPPGVWQVRVEEITKTPTAFVEDLVTVM